MAAARGAELDPATAAELRQLRAANRRQTQELESYCHLHAQASIADYFYYYNHERLHSSIDC